MLAPLGAGGMGEVYRACDTRLDRSVAVRVLPTELAGRTSVAPALANALYAAGLRPRIRAIPFYRNVVVV